MHLRAIIFLKQWKHVFSWGRNNEGNSGQGEKGCSKTKFYLRCSADNLCLFGHPNGTWQVTLPTPDVPLEIPEPAIGINFARDGMLRSHWLYFVAVHSDSWLLYVAFYPGALLHHSERKLVISQLKSTQIMQYFVENAVEFTSQRNFGSNVRYVRGCSMGYVLRLALHRLRA